MTGKTPQGTTGRKLWEKNAVHVESLVGSMKQLVGNPGWKHVFFDMFIWKVKMCQNMKWVIIILRESMFIRHYHTNC